MPAPRTLSIGIDETGDFREQKLGSRSKTSGVIAVASWASWDELRGVIKGVARDHGLTYPHEMHAMELFKRERDPTDEFSEGQTDAFLRDVFTATHRRTPFRVAVLGKLPDREFFHEQQAYGELLLCLLHVIAQRHTDILLSADAIKIYIATRDLPELTGFNKGVDYHLELCNYLARKTGELGMPRTVRFEPGSATQNPLLMLADFSTPEVRNKPDWVALTATIKLPASFKTTVGELMRTDRVSALLYKLHQGMDLRPRDLNKLKPQAAHETLRRLTAAAHAHVTDRHGQGSLTYAHRLIELLWPNAVEHQAVTVQSELCRIAAEVYSHLGRAGDDPEVLKWTRRAESLSDCAWASNTIAARAARWEYRCQTVQLGHFNVFAFDDVLWEFFQLQEAYELATGDAEAIAPGDELYGKILGTLGQACGFLRATDESAGADAFGYLEQSKPFFDQAMPLFRAINLGYRITDLWDRGELDEAESLMIDEHLPTAKKADAYSLLHRLRVAAFRVYRREPHEDVDALVKKLCGMVTTPEVLGMTPWDLCIKWALFLRPENEDLQCAAIKWLDALDTDQPALVATSLPLAAMLGRHDDACASLAQLQEYPGFEAHWATSRCAELRDCLAQRTIPGFEALRAMPWNYA